MNENLFIYFVIFGLGLWVLFFPLSYNKRKSDEEGDTDFTEEIQKELIENNRKQNMKISKEQSNLIYNRYKELKQTGKYTKGYIQKLLADEFEIGLTTSFDHGRGRELHDKNDENRNEDKEAVEKKVKEINIA